MKKLMVFVLLGIVVNHVEAQEGKKKEPFLKACIFNGVIIQSGTHVVIFM